MQLSTRAILQHRLNGFYIMEIDYKLNILQIIYFGGNFCTVEYMRKN